MVGSAYWAKVRRLGALRALRHVELDLLVLLQVLVALAGDRAEVHEHVGAVRLGDEAEALLGAEPLHGSSCHCNSSFRGLNGPACCPPAAGWSAGQGNCS